MLLLLLFVFFAVVYLLLLSFVLLVFCFVFMWGMEVEARPLAYIASTSLPESPLQPIIVGVLLGYIC